MSQQDRGFTLLEVLVALAIFAIVAASVLTASGRSLQVAEQLEEKTMAGWIADNRMVELQLIYPTPGEGREDKALEYGGREWETHSEIENTADKGMRRVTVWVATRPERLSGGPVKERSLLNLVSFIPVRG